MESLFEVDDIVYVQAKVLTVEEQENDVRYSVATNIAKFFCTEKGDKIRRSADSQNMINKSFIEGKDAFYIAISNVSLMSESDRESMFNETSMEGILANYTREDIENIYNDWVNKMSLEAGDVVDYTNMNSTSIYVIIAAYVTVDRNIMNVEDCTAEQLASPLVLSSKTLTLLDPATKKVYNGISIYDVVTTGKKIPVEAYLNDMVNDISEATYVDNDITGIPKVKTIIDKTDVDYDNYYDEDDEDE